MNIQTIYPSRYEFLMKNYQEGAILDIGNIGGIMGKGNSHSFHLKFKTSVSKESVVYGLDLADPPADLQLLYDRQIKCDLNSGIPWESNFFNCIYMGQVLEHLNQPFFALSEVYRLLKSNGKFICDIPNIYALSRIVKYVFLKKEYLGDPTHICFLTPASLLKILEISGFSIDEVATDWKEPMSWLPKPLKIGLGSHLLIAATKK